MFKFQHAIKYHIEVKNIALETRTMPINESLLLPHAINFTSRKAINLSKLDISKK